MFQRPRELDRVIGEYLNGNAVSDFNPPMTGAEDGGDDIALVKKVLAGIIAADNASDVERIVAFYEDERQSDGAWKIARLIWSDNLTE
jgi:hypothetical protein